MSTRYYNDMFKRWLTENKIDENTEVRVLRLPTCSNELGCGPIEHFDSRIYPTVLTEYEPSRILHIDRQKGLVELEDIPGIYPFFCLEVVPVTVFDGPNLIGTIKVDREGITFDCGDFYTHEEVEEFIDDYNEAKLKLGVK